MSTASSMARYRPKPGRAVLVLSGLTLLAISRGELSDPGVLQSAKRLLRGVLAHYLDGRTLRTRQVLASMRRCAVVPHRHEHELVSTLLLGVNVDHVATLRQARGTRYPDPCQAALLAEQAGADSITVHLREDRRHIQDADLTVLQAQLTDADESGAGAFPGHHRDRLSGTSRRLLPGAGAARRADDRGWAGCDRAFRCGSRGLPAVCRCRVSGPDCSSIRTCGRSRRQRAVVRR